MALLTSTAAPLLRPEDVGALVVQPVERQSVATQISTVVHTESTSFRIPIITSDPTSGWYAEGSDITPSDMGTDELDCVPKALKALSIISNELARDSSPAAQNVIGDAIARDLAKRIDSAYFGDTVSNGPSGLESLTSYQFVDTDSVPLTNVDAFSEAIAKAENVGATVTSFVANSTTALALSKVKQLTSGSNVPLLQSDPTKPTRRQILGVPLYVVPDSVVATGTVWAIDASRVFVVIRQDAELVTDSSRYFDSDRLGIRATLRVTFGFPHEESIVRISSEPGT